MGKHCSEKHSWWLETYGKSHNTALEYVFIGALVTTAMIMRPRSFVKVRDAGNDHSGCYSLDIPEKVYTCLDQNCRKLRIVYKSPTSWGMQNWNEAMQRESNTVEPTTAEGKLLARPSVSHNSSQLKEICIFTPGKKHIRRVGALLRV